MEHIHADILHKRNELDCSKERESQPPKEIQRESRRTGFVATFSFSSLFVIAARAHGDYGIECNAHSWKVWRKNLGQDQRQACGMDAAWGVRHGSQSLLR
jgi:hypothetical protein